MKVSFKLSSVANNVYEITFSTIGKITEAFGAHIINVEKTSYAIEETKPAMLADDSAIDYHH